MKSSEFDGRTPPDVRPINARKSLLSRASAAALAMFWIATAETAPGETRPNILLILVDDMRWDEMACAGHPFMKTPHIDRLAREGARFRNAFAVAPLCSPSRAGILTGQYPHRHGILDNTNRSARSHELDTFARRLHAAGYETGFIGKWHMGNDDTPRPGFDYWLSMKGQGESIDPGLNENGNREKVRGYVTDIFTERAAAFIEKPRSKPFLLYLAHKALHPNSVQRDDGTVGDLDRPRFIPAPRHESLYASDPIPRRRNAPGNLTGKPALQRRIGNLPPLGRETMTPDGQIRDRLRMLQAVDEGLGRLLEVLERDGKLESTLIIFTSDHGYFYGEHGLNQERRLAYEESIRIPLLLRYPKLIRGGSTVDATVLNIDLAPTLLELGGGSTSAGIQGKSLLPLLRGSVQGLHSSFLIEYYSDIVFPRIYRMGYKAVRTDRWKYIRYQELEGMDELYDLQTDPFETKNLIQDPSSQAALRLMRQELERLLR